MKLRINKTTSCSKRPRPNKEDIGDIQCKIPPAVSVEYIDSGSIGYFAFIPMFILVCGSIYFLILYLCN